MLSITLGDIFLIVNEEMKHYNNACEFQELLLSIKLKKIIN